MLREMSYTSLPQDEASSSERSTFITQGLMEYSPQSSNSNQKMVCFIASLLLIIGASLAIIIPILLDGPSNGGDPLSSHLNSDNGLSFVSNLFNKDGQNSTLTDVIGNSDNQNKGNTEINKYTTKVEEITGNPNDELTYKVVNTGDHTYIVLVHNNNSLNNNTHTNIYDKYITPNENNFESLNNMTIHNTTPQLNNSIINATFIVNDTESSNTSGHGIMNVTANPNVQLNMTVHESALVTTVPVDVNVTAQLPQQPMAKPAEESGTNNSVSEVLDNHIGSPWEPYQNNSYATHEISVISSLDNLTLVVLVALIAVSVSTLVAALAFIIHVKLETRKRRRNIANVITDLQSPDKIILLNSDESENSEESDEEYGRH